MPATHIVNKIQKSTQSHTIQYTYNTDIGCSQSGVKTVKTKEHVYLYTLTNLLKNALMNK